MNFPSPKESNLSVNGDNGQFVKSVLSANFCQILFPMWRHEPALSLPAVWQILTDMHAWALYYHFANHRISLQCKFYVIGPQICLTWHCQKLMKISYTELKITQEITERKQQNIKQVTVDRSDVGRLSSHRLLL